MSTEKIVTSSDDSSGSESSESPPEEYRNPRNHSMRLPKDWWSNPPTFTRPPVAVNAESRPTMEGKPCGSAPVVQPKKPEKKEILGCKDNPKRERYGPRLEESSSEEDYSWVTNAVSPPPSKKQKKETPSKK